MVCRSRRICTTTASSSLNSTSTLAAPGRRTGRRCTNSEPTKTTPAFTILERQSRKTSTPEAETSPKVSLSLSATADMFCPVDSSSSNHKWPEELYDLWSFFQRLGEKHVTLLRQVWAPWADRARLCSPLSVFTLNRDDISASTHTNSTASDLELQHVFDFGHKRNSCLPSSSSSPSCIVCTWFSINLFKCPSLCIINVLNVRNQFSFQI